MCVPADLLLQLQDLLKTLQQSEEQLTQKTKEAAEVEALRKR
jgi:hypothetical protein